MEGKKWLMKSIKNSTSFRNSLRSTAATTNFTADNAFELESELISSISLLMLIILYGIVVFSGIVGNSTLLITLCSQSSSRLKNPLLLALCVADLLVTAVAAPLSIVTLIFKHTKNSSWSLPNVGCKALHYLQMMPVAASTICLLMLSLDRYATVKHPRLAQLRQKRFLPSILATCAWLGACTLCVPILFAYKVTTEARIPSTLSPLTTQSTPPSNLKLLNRDNKLSDLNLNQLSTHRTCKSDYGSNEMHILFVAVYTTFVFVLPAIGVILNHIGVRKKLCALSLTARAAHGELPLPMPILRRQNNNNVIIVTGMANPGVGMNGVNDTSDEDFINSRRCSRTSSRRASRQNGNGQSSSSNRLNVARMMSGTPDEQLNLMAETRFRSPRTPRSIRRAQNQQMKNKLAASIPQQPAPELPIPQTSTLRSRRRLANILVAAGIVFAGCWMPHVFCMLCTELGINNMCPRSVSEFCLLLGFAHSALSPLLHWLLNYNSLRQSSCAPFARLGSAQRFLRSHLRFQAPQPPPSSTNEAALGPFNPRYIKARPQQYRPPASSHYLY